LDNNFMTNPIEYSYNDGELSSIGHTSESDDGRVIMGIRHSSRPHYGVQVS